VISVRPVGGLPEIEQGADLGALIAERTALEDGDVLVVAQKAVSKAEGRIVRLDGVDRFYDDVAVALADEPGALLGLQHIHKYLSPCPVEEVLHVPRRGTLVGAQVVARGGLHGR